MDNKKLIGSIVGVTAFIALIAGATLAWLNFSATVTNGSKSTGTMNFSVAYTQGTAVTNVPILATPTAGTAASLNVKANKVAGSVDGTLKIKLNTTTNQLASDALNYAVCVGTCADGVKDNLTTSTIKGKIANGTSTVDIYTGDLASSQTTYNIYFWLDPSKVEGGKQYAGYISATANQKEQ